MKIKFLANKSSASITSVEIERETANVVWINGRKSNKVTNYEGFHDSLEEAKAAIISYQLKRMERANRQISWAIEEIAKANSMTQEDIK